MKIFCYNCCNFVTKSKKIINILKDLKNIAKTDATVLLEGETGVGKEVLSCIIQKESKRVKNPFVKINCSAFPKDLIESELFGYAKGAFTGASGKREGKILKANGGTLLLDEISEANLNLQTKILRTIELGEIYPLGADEMKVVDVRYIITSNKDLEKEVEKKNFREDLYYRISSIKIKIPPLRERIEDIPFLFNYYLNYFQEKYKKNCINLEKRFIEKLLKYPFYGNIRELKGIAEKIILMGNKKKINFENIINNNFKKNEIILPLKEAVKNYEREYIKNILNKYNNNKKIVSKILKVSRKTLWLKLKDIS